MIRILLLAIALLTVTGCQASQPEAPANPLGSAAHAGSAAHVGTLAELMSSVILPTSNAILYVSSQTPASTTEWNEFLGKALMLAESAQMLNESPYAEQDPLWREDAQLLIDAAQIAFESSRTQDVDALVDLNGPLYDSCIKCHEDFEVTYGSF